MPRGNGLNTIASTPRTRPISYVEIQKLGVQFNGSLSGLTQPHELLQLGRASFNFDDCYGVKAMGDFKVRFRAIELMFSLNCVAVNGLANLNHYKLWMIHAHAEEAPFWNIINVMNLLAKRIVC
ncbi:hypothetical protein OIU85_009418 [Salix viminalis]|uniref:Uncharacterized protein n=1 Tax=Salix viminalis TaxID=40686 RepID=A0A9Q0SGF2_SALVM|nr:hypothetical protein OIU85_009418 [Salix viminalis]